MVTSHAEKVYALQCGDRPLEMRSWANAILESTFLRIYSSFQKDLLINDSSKPNFFSLSLSSSCRKEEKRSALPAVQVTAQYA